MWPARAYFGKSVLHLQGSRLGHNNAQACSRPSHNAAKIQRCTCKKRLRKLTKAQAHSHLSLRSSPPCFSYGGSGSLRLFISRICEFHLSSSSFLHRFCMGPELTGREYVCLEIHDRLGARSSEEQLVSCPQEELISRIPSIALHCESSSRNDSISLPECRICHEEEDVLQLETPCDCSGTLKYAHQNCVQRWCDEKGDTICEICQQPYKDGYSVSESEYRAGNVTLDIRCFGTKLIRKQYEEEEVSFVTCFPLVGKNVFREQCSRGRSPRLLGYHNSQVPCIIYILPVILSTTLPAWPGSASVPRTVPSSWRLLFRLTTELPPFLSWASAPLTSVIPFPRQQTAIANALEVGYRHLDTASIYKSEAAVGEIY